MLFSETLKTVGQPILQEVIRHPFVVGLQSGKLSSGAIQQYVEQDFQYLTTYIKIYAQAITKLSHRDDMTFFADGIAFVMDSETHPHHVLCNAANLDYRDHQHATPTPMAYLYECHMMQAANTGSLLNMVAAMLPCPWIYRLTAEQLNTPETLADNPFAEWITFYANSATNVSSTLFEWVDRLAESASAEELAAAKLFFVRSCELEWHFFDEAYRQADWRFPITEKYA